MSSQVIRDIRETIVEDYAFTVTYETTADYLNIRTKWKFQNIPAITMLDTISLQIPEFNFIYVAVHADVHAGRLLRREASIYPELEQGQILSANKKLSGIRTISESSKVDAEKIWLNGVLAWKVTDYGVPILSRRINYLDAYTGELITFKLVVAHDTGYAYPIGPPLLSTRPPLIDLIDVISPTSTNGGYSIKGANFQSSNFCFAYKCANGSNSTNGSCNELESICADTTGIKDIDYFTYDYSFLTDGRYIDLNRNWTSEGYPDGNLIMKWENAPVVAPRLKQPNDLYWGSDIDFSKFEAGSQVDAFDELQAYHYMTLHKKFMTNLLNTNDSTFCLLGSGLNCLNTDPVSNRSANLHTRQLKLIVNYQSINTNPDKTSNYADILTQIAQGRGKSVSRPITFDQSTSYSDAYFYSGSFENDDMLLNRSCSRGQCLSTQEAIFPHFAFGQTSSSDWALNVCIVFHELTHAFVYKYIPDLPSYVWVANGVSSEPGAMNEAWADYFAAIHCGTGDFRTTYNGKPNRDIDNELSCVDFVGEVHTVSL